MHWFGLGVVLLLPFSAFLRALGNAWAENPEFSFGILIPFIVTYLLWHRRHHLQNEVGGRAAGLAVAFTGCALQILSSMSGSFLTAGVALVMAILGTILYLWGPRCTKIAAAPVALLLLMIPLPGYVTGELSWKLQGLASTVSSTVLRVLGTPVLQEGNLLKIPNYSLEVKQACSGSRSLFALISLALVLGLSVTRKWWVRVLLVAVAPLLAVGANILRIVGTGLIARRWGALAADESLHLIWGIVVFVIAVLGLLGTQRFLRWATNEYA
jgi:exosortase